MPKEKNSRFSFLLYPESMITYGVILIAIGLIQTPFYGYTAIADPLLKLFEEPMDKVTFGMMLLSGGIPTYLFWREHKIGRIKLGLFALFFALAMRTFWEINWGTGAYMSAVYTYWSINNSIAPNYITCPITQPFCKPGGAWPTLDYIGQTAFYMNFILPIFAISTAACIFLLLSLFFEHKKK